MIFRKSIQGQAEFYITHTYPNASNPNIFLPGLGGSWNYEAMVHNATV